MRQNFILAIGGTGCRCAEALTYLYAARAVPDPAQILIIDPDEANGNRRAVVDQLQRYYKIHAALSTDTGTSRPFFSTPLNAGRTDLSFGWGHPSTKTPFKDLIGLDDLDSTDRDFLGLLYDETDQEMVFDQGYVGRAHVGSLDTFQTLQRAIKEAAQDIDQPLPSGDTAGNDPLRGFFREVRKTVDGSGSANLIVVGSVFGGTGASGLPVVPVLIREALGRIGDKVRMACIQMAPYFTFPDPRAEGDPDSTHHPLATQTALHHYARTGSGYDRLYLIGAPARIATSEGNHRGGRAQRNAAHYAELTAALAAAHFFRAPPPENTPPEVYACGGTQVGWTSLPAPRGLRQHMAAFTTFSLLHDRYVHRDIAEGRMVGAKWWVDLEKQIGQPLSPTDRAVEALKAFTSRYLEWASQVRRSAGDALYALPAEESRTDTVMLARVLGDDVKPQQDPFHELYRRLDRGGRFEQETAPGWYLDSMTEVAEEFCASNYDWWRVQ